MWNMDTPFNLATHETLHISSCHVIRIILRIAYLYWFVLLFTLYVLFASSRVDTDTEQFEKEFLYITLEDRVRAFSSDRTGEPTPSPILHFHALLIYCYPYVAILLCHVTYSTCYPIWSEIHLLALPDVCCLPASRVVGEFRVLLISRNVRDILLGGYHMLYQLLEIHMLYLIVNN